MKICMISDVHEQWQNLVIPPCDILISAGDYSYLGKPGVVEQFHYWMSAQKAKHLISVQGNHEVWVELNFKEAKERVRAIDKRIHFIAEGAVDIEGIKFYGSAIQPHFQDWAWNVTRGPKIWNHWAQIPNETQVLITHGPPHGILDQMDKDKEHLGCEELTKRVGQLNKLQLHVFGHIHGGSGVYKHGFDRRSLGIQTVTFVNASICNERYKPVNPVREFELNDNT